MRRRRRRYHSLLVSCSVGLARAEAEACIDEGSARESLRLWARVGRRSGPARGAARCREGTRLTPAPGRGRDGWAPAHVGRGIESIQGKAKVRHTSDPFNSRAWRQRTGPLPRTVKQFSYARANAN